MVDPAGGTLFAPYECWTGIQHEANADAAGRRKSMPKRATQVILPEKEREELVEITRRHRSEQQQVLRVHIVLAAA